MSMSSRYHRALTVPGQCRVGGAQVLAHPQRLKKDRRHPIVQTELFEPQLNNTPQMSATEASQRK